MTADALKVSILYNVALYGINQNIEDDNEEIYDLIANIVHDGDPKDGTYRVHILHTETGTWKEIQVFTVVATLYFYKNAFLGFGSIRCFTRNDSLVRSFYPNLG